MVKIETTVDYIVFDSGVKAIVNITSLNRSNCEFGTMVSDIEIRKFGCRNAKYQFEGIARYKDGDIFDVEMGKKVARKKAMRAMYGYWKNFEHDILNEAKKQVALYEQYVAELSFKKDNMNNDIKEITK